MRSIVGTLVTTLVTTLVLGTVTAAAARAQHVHSIYADQHDSGIASLSLEELDQLKAGEGMGLARAAELNHYPGPLHTLDMADSLALTAEQRTGIERLRESMLQQATAIGARIIEAERELSLRFEHGHADSTFVREQTAAIAAMTGQLRFVHLSAHLGVRRLLDPAQIETYDRLRGYLNPADQSAPEPSRKPSTDTEAP